MHSLIDPEKIICKLTIMVTFLVGMFKLLTLLRIFENFAPIVAMLFQVVLDLTNFIIVYLILTLMFSQLFGILGIHKYRDEYQYLPMGIANFIEVFRTAMGDYPSTEIDPELMGMAHNYAFWIIFMIILILNNIIFLNFVIAEASNSYSIVAEKLTQNILKAKSALIDEAQSVLPNCCI